jgi:segregation and condensation protein B
MKTGRRGELSKTFGKEVSRDTIVSLRDGGFIASGPRSPTLGAPHTYATTKHLLSVFDLNTLRDLPDFEALEDAGLLSKEKLIAGDIPVGLAGGEEAVEEDLLEAGIPDDVSMSEAS